MKSPDGREVWISANQIVLVLVLEWLVCDGVDFVDRRQDASLSRRDDRTQPGVLTPGTRQKKARPAGAEDCCYRVLVW